MRVINKSMLRWDLKRLLSQTIIRESVNASRNDVEKRKKDCSCRAFKSRLGFISEWLATLSCCWTLTNVCFTSLLLIPSQPLFRIGRSTILPLSSTLTAQKVRKFLLVMYTYFFVFLRLSREQTEAQRTIIIKTILPEIL